MSQIITISFRHIFHIILSTRIYGCNFISFFNIQKNKGPKFTDILEFMSFTRTISASYNVFIRNQATSAI